MIYGLRLTAYGLRLTAYGLRLTADGFCVGAGGEMLERFWVLPMSHWSIFSMKPFEKNGDQCLETFLKGQPI